MVLLFPAYTFNAQTYKLFSNKQVSIMWKKLEEAIDYLSTYKNMPLKVKESILRDRSYAAFCKIPLT